MPKDNSIDHVYKIPQAKKTSQAMIPPSIPQVSPVTPTPMTNTKFSSLPLARSVQSNISERSTSTRSSRSYQNPEDIQKEKLFKQPIFTASFQLSSNPDWLFDLVEEIERNIYGPGYCSSCYLLEPVSIATSSDLQHDPMTSKKAPCVEVFELKMMHFINEVRSMIRFEDFATCWHCRFPQFVCSGGDQTGNRSFSGSCEKKHLRDILLLPVYHFWQVGIKEDYKGWQQYNQKLSKLFDEIPELHTTKEALFMAYIYDGLSPGHKNK